MSLKCFVGVDLVDRVLENGEIVSDRDAYIAHSIGRGCIP